MKYFYTFLAIFFVQITFAQDEEQKVCSISVNKKNVDIPKLIKEANCQKGDILYIKGTLTIVRTAAHVCVIDTLKIQTAGLICEYAGFIREKRRKT